MTKLATTNLWINITNVILGIALVTFAFFALLALYQWIKRKSLRKIDPELRWSLVPFSLMAIVYLLFEKIFILSRRPNGSGEPSFPSTHTMVTATIFLVVISLLPRYIKSPKIRLILDLIMLALIPLIAIGRVIARMHWPSDVIGGMIFAGIFAIIYNLIIREKSTERRPHA